VKEAIDKPVKLTGQCFILFRLRGHRWTQILGRDHSVTDVLMSGVGDRKKMQKLIGQARKIDLNADDAKALSKRLKTRALYYGVSDTAGALGYELFENGQSIEKVDTEEGWVVREFKSSKRSGKTGDNGMELAQSLFTELDAYDPGLKFMYLVGYIMHKPGDKVTFRNTEDRMFERLDFVAI